MTAMRSYATSPGCRRAQLLGYFGEQRPDGPCGGCDNCARPGGALSRDLAPDARLLLAATLQTGEHYGSGVPVAVLLGSRGKDVTAPGRAFDRTCATFGRGAGRSDRWWKTLHALLVSQGLLAAVQARGAW